MSKAALLLTLVLVCTGCRAAAERLAEDALGDELGGNVDIEGGGYTVTDDTGTVRVSDELPPGLEVPVLNGATTIASLERRTDDDVSWLVDLRYPVDRYDEIIRFYAAYAESLDQPVSYESSSDDLVTTWVTEPPDRIYVGVELTTDAVLVKLGRGV